MADNIRTALQMHSHIFYECSLCTVPPFQRSSSVHWSLTAANAFTSQNLRRTGKCGKTTRSSQGGWVEGSKARYIGLIWEKMTKQMVSRWWLLFTQNLTFRWANPCHQCHVLQSVNIKWHRCKQISKYIYSNIVSIKYLLQINIKIFTN